MPTERTKATVITWVKALTSARLAGRYRAAGRHRDATSLRALARGYQRAGQARDGAPVAARSFPSDLRALWASNRRG